MGYALFTARKLSVTARLNFCNAQLMSNTEQAYALTASIFAKQNASAMKTNMASQAAYKEYESALKGGGDQDQAKATLDSKMAEISTQTAMDDAEIQELNQKQTLLDMQKKNLETQLQAYQNELDGVEKAEGDAIKNSAPKF